jgi:hypothetical protein
VFDVLEKYRFARLSYFDLIIKNVRFWNLLWEWWSSLLKQLDSYFNRLVAARLFFRKRLQNLKRSAVFQSNRSSRWQVQRLDSLDRLWKALSKSRASWLFVARIGRSRHQWWLFISFVKKISVLINHPSFFIVSVNFFGDKHGKNNRDTHFSNISKFLAAESLQKKLTSSQDVADAIIKRQKMADENRKSKRLNLFNIWDFLDQCYVRSELNFQDSFNWLKNSIWVRLKSFFF